MLCLPQRELGFFDSKFLIIKHTHNCDYLASMSLCEFITVFLEKEVTNR